MGNWEQDRIAANLTHRFEHSTDSLQIADAITSAWQQIDETLRPIIGQHGVEGLYKRSLFLATTSHPWLTNRDPNPSRPLDIALLGTLVARQSKVEAIAGGALLLHTFYELLANLIGPSLTERLLRSVEATFSSADSPQEPFP